MSLSNYKIRRIYWPKNLIQDNLGYVYQQAIKFSNYNKKAEVEDLVQCGCVALLKAWASFDDSLGVKFITHAAWWVKAFMFRYLHYDIHLIYIPSYLRNTRRKDGSWSHHNTDDITSFNSVVTHNADSGDDICLGETLVVSDNMTEQQTYEERQHIWNLLGYLEDRHAERLINYLGLGGDQPKTLQELGDIEGVSRERIRQKLKLSVEKLKAYLKTEEAYRQGKCSREYLEEVKLNCKSKPKWGRPRKRR